MALPQTDPSLPSNPSPIFGDIDAARGDHLRANNNIVWQNLTNLDTRIDANWVRTIFGDNLYGSSLVTNLDNIVKSGFYTAYGTATGVPSTSYSWFILHQNSAVGVVSMYQRAVAYSTTLIVMERTKIASTWGAWAVSGNIITSDTSSTDGEIVVESGTGGKTYKTSGKAIGNASGNVPLANGTKCNNLFADVSDHLTQDEIQTWAIRDIVDAHFPGHATVKFLHVTESCSDNPSGVRMTLEVHYLSSEYIRVFARTLFDKSTWTLYRDNNGWQTEGTYNGWTQLTDASGRSPKSLRLDSLPVATATPDILTQAWVAGAGTRFGINMDDTPALAWLPTNRPQYGQIEVYGSTNDSIKIFLRDTFSHATWCTIKTTGGNNAWVQLTDASGNAITANNALCLGGKTFAQLFDVSGNALTANNALCLGGKTFAQLFDTNGNAVGAVLGKAVHDVTASRALGTTYTNSNTFPIIVEFNLQIPSGTEVQASSPVTVGPTITLRAVIIRHSSISQFLSGTFIVPPGSTYKIDGTAGVVSLSGWTEIY